MPLTNAERQKMYRLRRDADPGRRASYLQQKKAKYKDDIAKQKRKRVADMSDRQLRIQRKEWRRRQRLTRATESAVNLEVQATADESAVSSTVSIVSSSTAGRKRVKRNRSALYRENLALREEVAKHHRMAEKYRKRCARLLKRQDKGCVNSPRKVAQEMLRKKNNSEIRKALVFHNVLIAQVREKYRQAETLRKKRSIAWTVSGQMIQKYRLISVLQKKIGMAQRVARKSARPECHSQAKVRSPAVDYTKVMSFFTRDDVSRVCAGVKQTITRHGVKKQKRILTDTLSNLHRKFVADATDGSRMSYSLFCKLRPFWVVPAHERDRDTCLCVLHENTEYVAKALKGVGLISCADLNYLVRNFMCNVDSETCAYNECNDCCNPQFAFESPVNDACIVSFFQWENTKKAYTKDGVTKEVKVTTKTRRTVTECDAVAQFLSTMCAFKQHWFTCVKQAQAFRECKNMIKSDECVVQVDFSENFNCKYHAEVQSVHFGASHEQASLHTVVIYIADKQPTCLCTISANLDHGPAGIWAHLKPIFGYIQENYPSAKHITFWSDGPSSQYKQKNNFARLCTEPFQYGFQSVSWNYFESAHGKGAADGVGAAIKRLADSAARQGKDVNTPHRLFEVVSAAAQSVKVFFVPEEDFEQSVKQAPSAVTVVKGTRQIHQVTSIQPQRISHRRLSCFCKWHTSGHRLCSCYNPKTFVFAKDKRQKTAKCESAISNRPKVSQENIKVGQLHCRFLVRCVFHGTGAGLVKLLAVKVSWPCCQYIV